MKKRRDFIKFMGRTTAALSLAPWLAQTGCSAAPRLTKTPPFTPLLPNRRDELSLAPGLNYEILIKWNDAINNKELFGIHNDFLAFQPFKGKSDEGVLLVNHEYFHPVLIHNRKMDSPRTPQEMAKEQQQVGASLIHIKKENNKWSFVQKSKYNRRITAQTPIPFQKGYKIFGSNTAIGTVANCAGGKTPWGTFLTCEENYDIFYGEVSFNNRQRTFIPVDKYKWFEHYPQPPEHYGWVVEINPFTGQAVKRNALGRFEHESATLKLSKSGFPVVYMGEDRKGGYIYKFISNKKTSLESGTLYVADTLKGQWIPLDLEKTPILKKHFDSQQDVLTYTHKASEVAGGTPQDRPEDIEIDPITQSIFVALTNNSDRGNSYGSLLKITEKNNDFESLEFTTETWLEGAPENGFICPDNMAFDNKGNLWLTVDIAEADIASGKYNSLGNNGLYYIPLRGPHAGTVTQVASCPVDAEFTGPMFSPDYKTLFLCVQHPGSQTVDPQKPTSRWPDGPGQLPKSAVVTISGPTLEKLTQ